GAELQRLFIDARQSAAGTLNPDFTGGKVLERGIIVYNSSDLLMANSPQYWAQVSFLFSDSDPEYVSGTQIFDHPALLANISILTEVSHNMWFKRPEVMALRQADIEGTWLEDEANRNDPVFQRYMDETNGNEQIAVLMTLANK